MKNNGGSRPLLYLIYFPLFVGRVEKQQKCLEEKTKQYFYVLLFIFSVKKRIASKIWTDIPKTLSKIWVNTFKCKSTLFKISILMKMKVFLGKYDL